MRYQQNNHYTSHQPKLLKSFDKAAGLVRDLVVARYGENFADTLYQQARQEFEDLIPQMPYIYKRTPILRAFLSGATQELAVYKVMKRHGRTAGEAWEICHDALRLRLKKVPKVACWLAERFYFSNIVRIRMKWVAALTQARQERGFVFKFIAGDGETFDFGIDYLACAIHKFACEQGAAEFAPYICLSDIALGETFGWGVTRSETLADGCQRCNFRFKKGGETRISSPTPEVQATIEWIRKREADLETALQTSV